MKIAYISQLRLPTKNAHGFQIMNMCSAFAVNGVEVELVIPWRVNLLKEDSFTFYNLPRNFKITKLPAIDLYPLRFIPEKISAIVHLFSFLLSARIYTLFKKADFIYTREVYASLFLKDLVYEVHSPEQMHLKGFWPRKFVVLNKYIKEQLILKGVGSNNILIAADAVNLDLFPERTKKEARQHLGFPESKKIALYFGNFKEWKGVDTLALAVPFLDDILVVMIGATKDSDLARIRQIVSGHDNVIIEGFKRQEEMPWYLASADVLVLPNTKKDENSMLYTSPMKLFEYMASKRPIVASDLPSLREILNENNAIFFKADNPKSLCEKIEELLNDEFLQNSLSKKAREDVGEFTWQERANKIIKWIC